MNVEALKGIGLTDGGIKIYLALLQLGSTTAGPIIKKTEMQRSTVYFCLESLIAKGLVSYVIKANRKYFTTASPRRLIEFVEEKRKDLDRKERKVKALLPGLFKMQKLIKEKQEANIYEGFKGMLSAFEYCLNNCKAGDKAFAFVISGEFGGADPKKVRKIITQIRRLRVKKKVFIKIIIGKSAINTFGKDQEKTPYTKVKYLSDEFVNPATVNVYGGIALIALWTERPIAFVVKNKDLADSFIHYFNYLWKIAKTRKEIVRKEKS